MNKVVARFQDGRVLKGHTADFVAAADAFHIARADAPTSAPQTVRVAELKAVFFVKDFRGHPERQDVPGFLAAPGTVNQGRKIAIRFQDAEVICGYSVTFTPGRDGFFVFPADAEGNNLRIYVLSAATSDVKVGPAAESLVRTLLKGPYAA